MVNKLDYMPLPFFFSGEPDWDAPLGDWQKYLERLEKQRERYPENYYNKKMISLAKGRIDDFAAADEAREWRATAEAEGVKLANFDSPKGDWQRYLRDLENLPQNRAISHEIRKAKVAIRHLEYDEEMEKTRSVEGAAGISAQEDHGSDVDKD